MPIQVKICCIQSPDEARLAIDEGAHALGLVSAMPSGPGVISEARIAEIAAGVPASVRTFLLTSLRSVSEIANQWARCGTTTIQLCDSLAPGALPELRRAVPGAELVQVIHVRDEGSIPEALAAADHVDALLLDSGNPGGRIKELGGTGRTHDWELSARVCRMSPVPVFLAGGLRAENVTEALLLVGPHGVDLCSGVRSDGRLDAVALHRFMDAVREASRAVDPTEDRAG